MTDETETAAFLTEVHELLTQLPPLLAGYPPPVQGAALADCLAAWLAGHCIRDNASETTAIREVLLEQHLAVVRSPIDGAIPLPPQVAV